MQYIPQKNIKSATASFADSLLIVCYELSYPHFMERRGSLYFSSEHTAYSPVNSGYLCEAIYYEFISCLSYYYIKAFKRSGASSDSVYLHELEQEDRWHSNCTFYRSTHWRTLRIADEGHLVDR